MASMAMPPQLVMILLVLVWLCSSSSRLGVVRGEGRFPSLFLFGDSLVDVGNNNYILTLTRANQRPFGIDFPQGPTGRFTNGKTILDVFAELLGLPFPPPYLSSMSKGAALVNGVNYGSAAARIRQQQRKTPFIGGVDLDTQLEWFGNSVEEVQQVLGVEGAQQRLAHSLFCVVIGSNDYLKDYFMTTNEGDQQHTEAQFRQLLLAKFQSQLTKLYSMGARNILVGDIGPLGCLPSTRANEEDIGDECSTSTNNIVRNYNTDLHLVLDQLNVDLPDSKFVYGDTFDYILDMSINPTKYGFKFGGEACCGLGKYGGQSPCLPILSVCPNRDDYVFWDSVHPSEKTNTILANQVYHDIMPIFNTV